MNRPICPAVRSYIDQDFDLASLKIRGIDNSTVLAANDSFMAQEEICLLHQDVASGDQYLDLFHARLEEALLNRKPFPVVRFADGEYAFYQKSLRCNGLYQQARSVQEIAAALPLHQEALAGLSRYGLLAPLIHQGNSLLPRNPLIRLIAKEKGDDSACHFLTFLAAAGLRLTRENYLPFYVVYAYLSSRRFARLVDGRHLCLVTSDIDLDACLAWFSSHQSHPNITFVSIPEAYLATQWPQAREQVLAQIPQNTDLCLVGAGIGALLVCNDLAKAKCLPAIDAGHVLNMINGRVDKSNGARLYTSWPE